jgi:hypothetical protein
MRGRRSARGARRAARGRTGIMTLKLKGVSPHRSLQSCYCVL